MTLLADEPSKIEVSDSSSEDDMDDSDASTTSEGTTSGSSSESDSEGVAKSFSVSYGLSHETAVSLEKNYICHMCGSATENKVAAVLSDLTACVYDLNDFKKLATFKSHSKTISDIRYHPNDPNSIITASLDGTVRLWDLRTPDKSVVILKDDTADLCQLKPFLCVDVSKTGHFLCAGTELFGGDAFLNFWDLRSTKLLGGYWESHSNDITQVRFHPTSSDIVASGSTDGLINIFDLSKPSEEDALLYSLNAETSVDKVAWHMMGGSFKGVSCITDTMDVQIWDQDGATPSLSFSRQCIATAMKNKSVENSYSVNVHQSASGDTLLLAGSASASRASENLCLMKINEGRLTPWAYLAGNKQIVRCSWLDPKSCSLVTAGESGMITLWQQGAEANISCSELKISTKQASHRLKPY